MTRFAGTTFAESAGPLAVGMDMSIIQHQAAGGLRMATGLLHALRGIPDLDILAWPGHRRPRRGGPARKVLNLLLDTYWLDVDLPRRARQSRRQVLMMPVSLTSGGTNLPQVVTIHDVSFLTAHGAFDRAYATYARIQFKRSVRRAAVITTISEHSRNDIIHYLDADPARVEVVYPGLDAPRLAPSHPPIPRPYALYVGATDPHKDVPTAINAWRELTDTGLDLAIVGQPGRDHERVTAMALAQNGRVHVVGRVSQLELEAWYGHATVFVFPSRAEGFGFPPLEAMRRGVPVVAARSTSLPEVLGDAALYHEVGSANEIAAQVRRVVGDSELRAQLIEAGREMSSRYTWDRTAAAMARLLDRAASGAAS